jgi:hypothetical protein
MPELTKIWLKAVPNEMLDEILPDVMKATPYVKTRDDIKTAGEDFAQAVADVRRGETVGAAASMAAHIISRADTALRKRGFTLLEMTQ